MLFTRVITASILAPLIIWAILKLPNNYFALLWGGVILLCGWEWSNLAGLKSIFARLLFLAVIAVSALPFWYWTDIIANIAQYFRIPGVFEIFDGNRLVRHACGGFLANGLRGFEAARTEAVKVPAIDRIKALYRLVCIDYRMGIFRSFASLSWRGVRVVFIFFGMACGYLRLFYWSCVWKSQTLTAY